MADFMSVQPVSGLGNAVRPTPPVPQPMVAKPAESSASGSSGNYSFARDPGQSAANARLAAERRPFDDNVLTGPPPAFEASLLEVEGNLEATIRRIEQARERARSNDEASAKASADQNEESGDAPKAPGLQAPSELPDKALDAPVSAEAVPQPVTGAPL